MLVFRRPWGRRFALGNERRLSSLPPARVTSRGRWVILMPGRQRCKPSFVPPTRRASGFGGEGHLSGPAFADELSRLMSGSGLPAAIWSEPIRRRCLALHPVGFTLPTTSLPPRCALTAPFHPYRRRMRPDHKGRTTDPSACNGQAGGCATSAVYFLWHCPCPSSAVRCRRRTVGVTHHRGSVVLGLSSARRKVRTAAFHATSHFGLYQTLGERAS